MLYFAPSFSGGIAQLVERLNGIQKVRSSTLLTSTIKRKRAKRKASEGSPFLFPANRRPIALGRRRRRWYTAPVEEVRKPKESEVPDGDIKHNSQLLY